MAAISTKSIPCLIKTATTLQPGSSDERGAFSSGCKVIDINFDSAVVSEIAEIHVTNFYTALLTVRVKLRDGVDNAVPKWRTCVRRLRLMPEPHCEAGSHDTYILTNKQFSFELLMVTDMRLILQQPSPVWKDFHIEKFENIHLYKTPQNMLGSAPIPSWLTTEPKLRPKHTHTHANIDQVSNDLLKMWALTENVADNQATQSLGRYDVHGCYDVTLLNFT